MLTIPHKEVRYLLPLTIPVFVIAASGVKEMVQRMKSVSLRFQVIVVSLAILIIVADFGKTVLAVMHEAVDRSITNEVEIAHYLREHSSPRDTIYAAHNYPVYAFYTERKTVSLLPIQEDFDSAWRREMNQAGFLVYTHPDQLGEIHSISKLLKPDRAFLDAHSEFRAVQEFSTATVYRYDP